MPKLEPEVIAADALRVIEAKLDRADRGEQVWPLTDLELVALAILADACDGHDAT